MSRTAVVSEAEAIRLIKKLILERQAAFARTRDLDDREHLSMLCIADELGLTRERTRMLIRKIERLNGLPIYLWLVQARVATPAMKREIRRILREDPAIGSHALQYKLRERGRELGNKMARQVLRELRGPMFARRQTRRQKPSN